MKNLKNQVTAILFFTIAACFAGEKTCAQDTVTEVVGDTVSVRIEGDSIVYRKRIKEFGRAGASATTLRSVPDSLVEKMKSDREFLYANDPNFWKKEPPPDPGPLFKLIDWMSKSALMRWILYLFLGAVIIFALYQIMVVNDFFIFSRKKKGGDGSEDIPPEELASRNLDDMLNRAMAAGDYRLATRLLYFKTLQFLHSRNIIQLNAKSTNQDYIRQTQKTNRGNHFRQLTRIYEYAWYGEYAVSEQQFEQIHKNFNSFISEE